MSVSYEEISQYDLGIETVQYLPITQDLLIVIVVGVLIFGIVTGYLIAVGRAKRGLPLF